jgi:hypothetical protein
MHYRIPGLLFFLAAFTLAGCIETQMLITVHKDGSGTIRETLMMSKAMLEPLKEMVAAMKDATTEIGEAADDTQSDDTQSGDTQADDTQSGDTQSGDTQSDDTQSGQPQAGETPPPFELFSDEEIRGKAEKLGRGVCYVSHEMHEDDERQGYTAMYSFNDISTVQVNQNPGASVPSFPGSEEVMESDEELVMFSFTKGNPATLVIRPPKGGSESETEPGEAGQEPTDGQQAEQEGDGSEEGFEQMKEFLRGMKVTVQVAVDGDIEKTNASYVDGSTITVIDLSFDRLIDDPELMKQLQKSDEMSPAAAKEMLKNIPGIRVEMEEEITVTFK